MNMINLKAIRKKLRWSQEDLARQLGVSLFTVSRWEQRTVRKPHRIHRELLRNFEEKVKRGEIEAI
jgi:DNA-binding transcriptional regulator YiaG